MSLVRGSSLLLLVLVACLPPRCHADELPYLFTDQTVELALGEARHYTLQVVGDAGLSAERNGPVTDGKLVLTPGEEGIFIIRPDQGAEIRFLAMAPPPPLDAEALRRALPHNADRLLDGEPFRLLAMGDSVTATGAYETMLQMLLARATGNLRIEVIDRSYPGRSVDASIRNFEADAVATQPHAAMIMYGLNDQGAGCSLDGYLEQFAWLVARLRDECRADPILLLPTPDISLGKDATDYTPYILRTVGYGSWLRHQFASDLPVVDTFHAIWGTGGDSLQSAARAMWPRFPTHFRQPFTSLVESGGVGDGIHPNALGHLAMAKAVYATLMGLDDAPGTHFSASSAWDDAGLYADIAVRSEVSGRLEIYPLPDDTITIEGDLAFERSTGVRVRWPAITTGNDLLRYPANRYFYTQAPMVVAIAYTSHGSRVHAIAAPAVTPAHYLRERQSITGGQVEATLVTADERRSQLVTLPAAPVGRIPLVTQVGDGWAAAEVAFVRYGAARRGEAVVDGDLAEWEDHHWIPVGEPVQARWTRGPADHRASIDECYTEWSFKAGESGIYLAARVRGDVNRDSLTLFFDPRPPEQLGTPGPYYWLSVGLDQKGKLQLRPGETSDRSQPTMKGVWQPTETGANLELFVPYTLLKGERWPVDGDLGLSIHWRHRSPDDAPDTHLQWSEDGHPWNPRWYGVVRLTDDPETLPYMVRIK